MTPWVTTERDRWGSSRQLVCPHNRALVVQHCGHPTANYPWYVVIDGIERMDLGTHRLLGQAQRAAMLAWEAEGMDATLDRIMDVLKAARAALDAGSLPGPLWAELRKEAQTTIPLIRDATK